MMDSTTRFSPRPQRAGRLVLALASVFALSMPATGAWAQIMGDGPVGTTGHASGRQKNTQEKPSLPAPDALPGARPSSPVAPATKLATDMPPTDALFDAINRGDIAAARDALNRGADLNGTNILGMTPMELSVDLGRNDISFLLLSMRGEDTGWGSRAAGRTPEMPKTVAKAEPAPKQPRGAKATSAAIAPVKQTPPAAPKLFANDGGKPLPSAGFLGFDSRSASN